MWKPPKFRRPPPVPVYEPTEAEFKDPLAFISSIRAEGERYGVVKIRPPPSFQPPFALNIEDFRFRPRRQRISELSACTRVRQNFLDRVSRFWELQGVSLKIPRVENELLCLFTFHEEVQKLGGFVKCSEDRKWGQLALSLGFASKSGSASALRAHYERILYPFDVLTQDLKAERKHPSRRSVPNKAKVIREQKNNRGATDVKPDEKIIKGGSNNKELARLQLFGAGPKMQGLGINPSLEIDDNGRNMRKRDTNSPKTSPKKHAEVILRCEKCGVKVEMSSVVPKLHEIPKEIWHCPTCMKTFVGSLMKSERFGFEQSDREYNLREFGERADEFKREYFGLPPHHIDLERVEEEFWRLTDDIEGDLTVEYGADIQAVEKGSGFCSRFNPPGSIEDSQYKEHPWNLVNLPVAKKSVLQYLEGDISGVKVPWLYVGMCFSAFAWHTEDHWTYSINYHHFGEPKVWYCASRFSASKLEEVYKAKARDLYTQDRDLMHHITTTISPTILQENGVEIYRAVQNAGEFIITFPRGYHAGFNSGLNMNEAVNFCPPDWITIGREALTSYRNVKRYNIFSQDELILTISQEAVNKNSVEGSIVTLTHQDLKFMIKKETSERNQITKLLSPNVHRTRLKKDTFCGICQTAVYISYIMFDRRANIVLDDEDIYDVPEGFIDQGIVKGRDHLVCLLCAIGRLQKTDIKPQHVNLMVNWEIEELTNLCDKLKRSLADYEHWEHKIQQFRDNNGTLEEFRELLNQGGRYDTTRMYQNVRQTIDEAEKANVLIQEVFNSNSRPILTHNDLSVLVERIKTFPFMLEKTGMIREQLRKVNSILDELKDEDLTIGVCENLIHREKSLLFEVSDMKNIRQLQKVIRFMPKLSRNYQGIEEAQKVLEEGYALEGFECNKAFLARLKCFETDLEMAMRFASTATEYLEAPDNSDMEVIGEFLEGIQQVTRQFSPEPCLELAREHKATQEWLFKFEKFLKPALGHNEPSLKTANRLLMLAVKLQLHPAEVGQLHDRVESAEEWIERLKKVFLKKGSFWTLKEVLLPRTFDNSTLQFKEMKERKKKNKLNDDDINVDNITDSDLIDVSRRTSPDILQRLERREIEIFKEIRMIHHQKLSRPNSMYCTCQRVAKSVMYACDLCAEWHHLICHRRTYAPSELCVRCVRSRRPSLSSILPLLQDLQAIELQFDESDYLQALIERVVRWQSNYKCMIPDLTRPGPDTESSRSRAISLYLESLLIEVSFDDQNDLREKIKLKAPQFFTMKPPEGAQLGDDAKTPNRKRRDKDTSDVPRRYQNPRKKKPQVVQDEDDDDDDNDVDDDGPCASDLCKRPDSDKVDWVYCERCSKWYHLFCLNMSTGDVKDDQEFVCNSCSRS